MYQFIVRSAQAVFNSRNMDRAMAEKTAINIADQIETFYPLLAQQYGIEDKIELAARVARDSLKSR